MVKVCYILDRKFCECKDPKVSVLIIGDYTSSKYQFTCEECKITLTTPVADKCYVSFASTD